MPQHQVLGFRIHRGTLPRRTHPRGSDLDVAIRFVDIHIARAADHAAGALLDGDEGQGGAVRLALQGEPDVSQQVLARVNGRGDPAPQIGIEADLAECVMVFERERFHADNFARESNGFNVERSHAHLRK